MQIVVLSRLMFRRAVFGRGVAFLGVFSGIFGIVAGFLAGESDFLFYLGLLPSFPLPFGSGSGIQVVHCVRGFLVSGRTRVS